MAVSHIILSPSVEVLHVLTRGSIIKAKEGPEGMREKCGYCAGSLDEVHIRDLRSYARSTADASRATVAADTHVHYWLVAT